MDSAFVLQKAFDNREHKTNTDRSPPFKIAGAFCQPQNGSNAGDQCDGFQKKTNKSSHPTTTSFFLGRVDFLRRSGIGIHCFSWLWWWRMDSTFYRGIYAPHIPAHSLLKSCHRSITRRASGSSGTVAQRKRTASFSDMSRTGISQISWTLMVS